MGAFGSIQFCQIENMSPPASLKHQWTGGIQKAANSKKFRLWPSEKRINKHKICAQLRELKNVKQSLTNSRKLKHR